MEEVGAAEEDAEGSREGGDKSWENPEPLLIFDERSYTENHSLPSFLFYEFTKTCSGCRRSHDVRFDHCIRGER